MRWLVLILFLLAPSPCAWADPAQDLIAAVNAARRQVGLAPLRSEERLARAAQDYAAVLAEWGRLSHKGPEGSGLKDRLMRQGYPYREAAENLASGLIDSQKTVGLWLQSPGHRANMLKPDVQDAGVGVSRALDGQAYWTLLLGRRVDDHSQPLWFDLEEGP
ncbi:MAG: CAP domain-containing protein [Alphaproteobacteria bacterium]|nr:CAP domain-containing protein [Alphaproteobacteria bacterium]